VAAPTPGATLPREVSTPSPTQLKVLVPGNHLMVNLLGHRDELLKLVEEAFPVAIHVRGNEITVTGDAPDAERVGRLFEELVVLIQSGHALDAAGLGRSIDMLKADQRPTEVLGTEVLRGRKPGARQDRRTEALRRRRQRQHRHLRHRSGRDGEELPPVALAVQALQAKAVNRIILTRPAVEAGERLGFLPRRRPRQGRTVPAARSTTPSTTCSTPRPWVGSWIAARSRSPPSRSCVAGTSTTRSSSSTRRRTPPPSR